MGKVKRLFVCSGCGRPSAQWSGRCFACGEWGSVAEHPAGSSRASAVRGASAVRVASLAFDGEEARIETGMVGFDRVLGGGLLSGSVVLVAGAPGIGKSTLLLQLASHLQSSGRDCLLASGEEARGQVAARARRLGIEGSGLSFTPGRDLDEVIATATAERPAVLLVDSIHTLRNASLDAAAGSPGQVRACVDALVGLAKEEGITTILAGHVTKAGDLAGPRTIEHAVDAVLTFEGDHRSGLRVLSGGKNRFGPEGEVAWYQMSPSGLRERESGPVLGDGAQEPGCATALALAGRRALAVEVQALVVPAEGPPRRQVAGLDPRRFHLVAAVAERATRLRLVRSELFGAAAGGMRLDDPGADLAIAAALVSAATGSTPPAGMAFAGEVGLTGTVRPAGGLEQRASAAAAAGLSTLVCAAAEQGGETASGRIRLHRVGHVREAVAWSSGRR